MKKILKAFLPTKTFAFAICNLVAVAATAQVAHFPMSLNGGKITEVVSGNQYVVNSQLPACCVEGLLDEALLLDGWSNYISAQLPTNINYDELTMSVLLAPQTYPMMCLDVAETDPTYGTICGNLSEDGKNGFAIQLSSQGDIRVAYGISAYARTLDADVKLPRGMWNRLTLVHSKSGNTTSLYLNDQQIASIRANNLGINPSDAAFMIGKDAKTLTAYGRDGLNINTFVGLIDDIALYDHALSADEIQALPYGAGTDILPDFNFPSERYAQGKAAMWRPQFHGMPSAAWTNESHGLTYYDGRYHVFFQKNANGPYMSRLHWGHISSSNLYQWTEEPIAFGPDASYDIKGCWSGCVFYDSELTSDKPGILYTAVDNAKATIALVNPKDEALIEWEKYSANPIINGRPSGLSDDFRDPYFFTANGEKYIIVGTSKNNMGACTLHRYNNGTWSNNGDIFFQATSASLHGTFWEMPNVTPMADGKWLFTCTPLGTSHGVRTICWVGTIDSNGCFVPTSDMQYLELNGISKDGYGLLSPSFLTTSLPSADGSNVLLGIVPDKLPIEQNMEIGWAHNYSLPREISLDANDRIIQKPYHGLTAMRTDNAYSQTLSLNGAHSLAPVSGRQIELDADFTVGSTAFGFSFLKSGSQEAKLCYDPATNTIQLDLTSLNRIVNDGVYAGVYAATLPEKPSEGDVLNMHVYLDGSIADIFVGNKWAFSVRIFPTDVSCTEAEVFGNTEADVKAWVLDAGSTTAIDNVIAQGTQLSAGNTAFYNISGQRVDADSKGIVISNGKKYVRN